MKSFFYFAFVTIHKILMLKVKAISWHSSTFSSNSFVLKNKRINLMRFSTLDIDLAPLAISFVLEDTLDTIKREQVEKKTS